MFASQSRAFGRPARRIRISQLVALTLCGITQSTSLACQPESAIVRRMTWTAVGKYDAITSSRSDAPDQKKPLVTPADPTIRLLDAARSTSTAHAASAVQ